MDNFGGYKGDRQFVRVDKFFPPFFSKICLVYNFKLFNTTFFVFNREKFVKKPYKLYNEIGFTLINSY